VKISSGADPGFLIIGPTICFWGGVTKSFKNLTFPSALSPPCGFRGGAKWIFRIFKGEKQIVVERKNSKKHNWGSF